MAETTIYTILQDATDEFSASPSVVFTTALIGYSFYCNSAVTPAYKKTTDGGLTWGGEVTLSAVTGCSSIAVWYDQWTPGDTTGAVIHCIYADATLDGAYYRSINTASSDAQGTETDVTGDLGIWSVGDAGPSICKATDGDLFVSMGGSSTTDVWRAASGGLTFASTSASAFLDDRNDILQLLPLASGDIMLVHFDTSANTLNSRVYTSSWGSNVSIDASVVDSAAYPQVFSATLYKLTNDIYVVYNNAVDTSTGDVKSALYSGGVWTAKTNVLTDINETMGVSIVSDDNNSDIYALYARGGTAGSSSQIYYKKSTDDMVTWGVELQLSTTVEVISFPRSNFTSALMLYAVWYKETANDLLGDVVKGITLRAASQATGVLVSKPTGTVNNDVMICTVGTNSTNAIVTLSGWTLIRSTAGTSGRMATFYKVAASEGADYTWDVGGASRASTSIIAYRNVDTSSVKDVEGGQSTDSTATPATPTVTTTVSNVMLVASYLSNTTGTWTAPTGMTERADVGSGPPLISTSAHEVIQAAAGATGTKTATCTSSGNNVQHIVALKSFSSVLSLTFIAQFNKVISQAVNRASTY